MAEPVTLPAADVNKAVYVALATAQDNPAIDILAGITCHMVLAQPGLSAQELRDSIGDLVKAIVALRPAPRFDVSPNAGVLMSRILARMVPALTSPRVRAGARRYARELLKSYKRGAGPLLQIAPIDLQFNQIAEVDRFRRATWQQLYDLAKERPEIAKAVDQSGLAEAIDVETTQDAVALLRRVPLEPLSSFVTAHLQPDGGLVVMPHEVQSVLEGVTRSMDDLRASYAENLVGINAVEQQARVPIQKLTTAPGKPAGGAKGKKPKSPLAEAISKAEKKQQELDKILKKVATGSKSTLDVLAFVAGRFDEEFAEDIKEYTRITGTMIDATRRFANGAIETAKAVEGVLSAGADKLLLYGGIGFNFAVLAMLIQVSGLLGKSRGKPINQVILEGLRKISEQLTELGDQLHMRFDQIERQLDKMYVGILNRLAEIDFKLGQVAVNVEELQVSAYELHSKLQRLNRDIHGFLKDAHRRGLVEAMNGFLGFQELTGQELGFEGFREAENVFFSWGRDHARDSLEAGPEDRDFRDDALLTELTNLPLVTNINYLRQLPSERFGLPPLSSNRLANPLDWILAAEAYAQLSEESPGHADQISPARVDALISVGESLGESLARIANKELFAALANQYRLAFADLKKAIAAFEREFRADTVTQLHKIDLWGGGDQPPPATHFFLEEFGELRRCDGRKFGPNTRTMPTPANLLGFDHKDLSPYMIASNLSRSKVAGVAEGLERLSACATARWMAFKFEPVGLGGRVRITYRLTVTVDIRYGESTVMTHRIDTNQLHVSLVPKDQASTFDPTREKDPYEPLLAADGGDLTLWDKLGNLPATHSLGNPSLRAATIAAVNQKLVLLQREFYARVAQKFKEAGDAIHRMGQRLTGSKLLWQSFVTAGLPFSIEANELLRGLLFGSEGILAGADTDEGEGGVLDNLQDIYAFFSNPKVDLLPENILGELEEITNDRLERLTAILTDIVDAIETSGQPEPPVLFAPTLLRLSLLRDA